MKYKVAAIQMDCILRDWSANMTKAQGFVTRAAEAGASLTVLPELFSTGFRLDGEYYQFAESIPEGKTVQTVISWAERYKMHIVGCITERGEVKGSVFDTAFLVGPGGFIGKYRKVNPWWQEKLYFQPGNDFPVWETPLGNVGLMICYDGGFPEIARQLALNGADILILPSAFGKARLYAWELFTRARALENGCFLISSNRVGQEKDATFAGHSRIVNTQGIILAEVKDREDIILAEVDLEEIITQRRTIPYQQDLRRDRFAYITKN